MPEFCMPSLGADMREGTIVRWLVAPGSAVSRGDVIVEVETEKANMEVEIFDSGVVEQILVPEGEKVPVGTPLALVRAAAEASVAAPLAAPAADRAAEVVVEKGTAEEARTEVPKRHRAPRVTPTAKVLAAKRDVDLASVHGTGIEGAVRRADIEHACALREAAAASSVTEDSAVRRRVSPYARRLAAERSVDLRTISGSGGGGAIVAADVLAAAASPAQQAQPPAPAAGPAPTSAPVPSAASRRRPIVALMERANREIPHYYLGLDVDMGPALRWLEATNAARPVARRILSSALLVRVVALAAREVPEVNGFWKDGLFEPLASVNVGMAISMRGGGVIAPAIVDADQRNVDEVMAALRDLVARARTGKLRASEMSSGTITITNLGDLGVDFVQGVIFPPQVALVGFGRIRERPWAEGGMIGARPVVTATLAADHRASDGHRGGLFLTAIDRLLKEPEKL